MKKYLKTGCQLLLICLIYSCASRPVAPPKEWRYEKDAVRFHLKADSQLNLHEGMPHTLHVCVYQLRDPNAFVQLIEDEDGLYRLLECSRFDGSVASSKGLTVQPGEDFSGALDRAEGAKYVGIVAGYYQLHKEGIVRLFEVPVVVEKRGFFRRTKISKPGPLDIDLVLGSHQIQKFGGNNAN